MSEAEEGLAWSAGKPEEATSPSFARSRAVVPPINKASFGLAVIDNSQIPSQSKHSLTHYLAKATHIIMSTQPTQTVMIGDLDMSSATETVRLAISEARETLTSMGQPHSVALVKLTLHTQAKKWDEADTENQTKLDALGSETVDSAREQTIAQGLIDYFRPKRQRFQEAETWIMAQCNSEITAQSTGQ